MSRFNHAWRISTNHVLTGFVYDQLDYYVLGESSRTSLHDFAGVKNHSILLTKILIFVAAK